MFLDFLKEILIYRVMDIGAISRYCPNLSPRELNEICEHMVAIELLSKVDLFSEPVYQITQTGFKSIADEIGDSKSTDCPPKPLSRTNLVRAYGLMRFCHEGTKLRYLLSASELSHRYPPLSQFRRNAWSFYVEDEDSTSSLEDSQCLGICYVDAGRSPERLLRDMHENSRMLAQIDGLAPLVAKGGIRFGLVVADIQNTKRPLMKLLQKRPLPTRPHIMVVPELLELMEAQES